MAASLLQPGWDCLLDPSAGWEAGEGGWRMTQSGPQGGVRRFLLWQVQAKGSGDDAGSCCTKGEQRWGNKNAETWLDCKKPCLSYKKI